MSIKLTVGRQVLELEAGTNLMEALTSRDLFRASCGGHGTCGKCGVQIRPAPQPTQLDRDHLTTRQLKDGWRLACGITLAEDVTVILPEKSREAKILTGGQVNALPDLSFRRMRLSVPPATLENPVGDAERFEKAAGMPCPEALLPHLSRAVRQSEMTVLLQDNAVCALEDMMPLGLAVDIGTTTVVAYLLELETGKQLAVASCLNPQKAFGDDVIARIDYAKRNEASLLQMQRVILDALNLLIGETLAKANRPQKELLRAMVVGNTTMIHLFLGITPEHIAAAPFVPAFTGAQRRSAGELGLNMAPGAVVETLPNLSSYVGADILASVMASGMDEKDEITLLLDIGTNGEMALGSKEQILACSTAAGPALEGAHIACGMGGVKGAVSQVAIENGQVRVCVLGGGEAVGICGSGLVDAVAALLKSGIMDETGRIDEDEAPDALTDRFVRDGRNVQFFLTDQVFLSQKDIREVQLAKAAIAAGIRVLCDARGISLKEIDRVCLAGGFGNYIDKASACVIGLLPAELQAKILSIGNGAGAGAQMALVSRSQQNRARSLTEKMRYLELSAVKAFQDFFVDEMSFE